MLTNTQEIEKIDPRVKRTRALIQQAFIELIREKGFHSVTIQDITQKAEVNRATFYAHFQDKYALLETSIHNFFRDELEKRTLSACHYSDQNLQALIITVCEFITRVKAIPVADDGLFETLIERQVRNQIQDLLEMWLKQVGSEIDLKTAATAATWSTYGLVMQWSKEKQAPPQEAFAKRILPLIIPILHLKAEYGSKV